MFCVLLCLPTCLFIQGKQTGHVTRKDFVGNLSKSASISVSGENVEDFCAGLCVVADAHGVLVRVKHWSVIIQVFYVNVNVGLSVQASLTLKKKRSEFCVKDGMKCKKSAVCQSKTTLKCWCVDYSAGSKWRLFKNEGQVHRISKQIFPEWIPLTGSSALIRMSWTVCPESRSISWETHSSPVCGWILKRGCLSCLSKPSDKE